MTLRKPTRREAITLMENNAKTTEAFLAHDRRELKTLQQIVKPTKANVKRIKELDGIIKSKEASLIKMKSEIRAFYA